MPRTINRVERAEVVRAIEVLSKCVESMSKVVEYMDDEKEKAKKYEDLLMIWPNDMAKKLKAMKRLGKDCLDAIEEQREHLATGERHAYETQQEKTAKNAARIAKKKAGTASVKRGRPLKKRGI